MKKILAIIGMLPMLANAASVTTTTGVTSSATAPASSTIDSGSNRLHITCFMEEINTQTMVLPTSIGGQSPTETFNTSMANVAANGNYDCAVWNESAISAMSGTTWAGDSDSSGGDGFWVWWTVEDADQTALGAFDATVEQDDQANGNFDITTTSSAGDLIVVLAMRHDNLGGGTWDSCDTLTEYLDDNTEFSRQFLMCAGDGGDGTTSLSFTNDVTNDSTAVSLIVPNGSNAATLRRRR